MRACLRSAIFLIPKFYSGNNRHSAEAHELSLRLASALHTTSFNKRHLHSTAMFLFLCAVSVCLGVTVKVSVYLFLRNVIQNLVKRCDKNMFSFIFSAGISRR